MRPLTLALRAIFVVALVAALFPHALRTAAVIAVVASVVALLAIRWTRPKRAAIT